MSRCKDCKYAEGSNYRISNIECCTCSLTRRVMNANADSDCNCFNRDLSGYDICYNCKYYGGGGDWGLFCSHEDMYHHLGKFSDEPCKRYERRTDVELREYPQEEYEQDMKTLLAEKGLSGAVKIYLDKINEEVEGMGYVAHRTVQEYLCDILFLAQEAERRTDGSD